MNLSSITELDYNETGEWPLPYKITALILLCLLLWGGGYYFIVKDKRSELAKLTQQEAELKTTFEIKQAKAVNLDAYKEQLAEMGVMFSSMLEQLPKQSEVPELLEDITRTGLFNGLEFELFKPESERPMDFYAELPVNMIVTGTYHQFGEFISGLAALPRIVTIHDLKIEPMDEKTGKMTMDMTAKTYRYFDEE